MDRRNASDGPTKTKLSRKVAGKLLCAKPQGQSGWLEIGERGKSTWENNGKDVGKANFHWLCVVLITAGNICSRQIADSLTCHVL